MVVRQRPRAGIVPFNLGNVPNPERLRLIINDVDTGGFEYDRGGQTRFEDFTVWKWHPSLFDLRRMTEGGEVNVAQ